MTGCVASPATPWTTNQRMVLGDGTFTSWSGTNWVGGPAPLEGGGGGTVRRKK